MNDKLRATVELAAITGQDRKELRVHFQARTNGRLVAKDLDESQAEAVQALDLAGVHLRRSFKRRHPSGSLAPHVVGFVLADGRGGAGIEGRFEDLLSGSPGHERIMVDALGRPLMTFDTEYQAPVSGANVQLTIDAAVQREVETALAEAIEKHAPTSAAAIVIRPATGEVLAMASWPTFSVDDFSGADPSAFRNNVLAFVYESGSTMKPLIAGAAVADGQVRWDEKVFCENGRWTYRAGRARRTITDHSLKYGGHQWLTVSEGVAKSDNVLMAKLGIEMGPERLYEWVRHLGFGTVTGIDLAGENVGIMLPRHQWNHIGSCMSVPMAMRWP
jgi:cell division protein FtsI (penicillin-binding protein 3)